MQHGRYFITTCVITGFRDNGGQIDKMQMSGALDFNHNYLLAVEKGILVVFVRVKCPRRPIGTGSQRVTGQAARAVQMPFACY